MQVISYHSIIIILLFRKQKHQNKKREIETKTNVFENRVRDAGIVLLLSENHIHTALKSQVRNEMKLKHSISYVIHAM